MAKTPRVLVLSGFLGSGKTTLLVQLANHLRKTRGEGYGIAIIENEVGSASVDTGVVQEAGYTVTEMLSGCACCTLVGQLVPALERLADGLSPDLVILEATGIASPGPIRDSIERYGGNIVRVATLVDASRWERIRMPLGMLLEEQIEPADVVCVSKCDLVDRKQLAEVERAVREMNVSAPIVYASALAPMSTIDLDMIAGE